MLGAWRSLRSQPALLRVGRGHAWMSTAASTPHVDVKKDERRGITAVSTTFAGKDISLEVGRLGPLTDGAVLARCGDTTLLATAVCPTGFKENEQVGMLPLTVDYREKMYSRGVIPTTWNRREPGTSEKEILGARMIDRSIRPAFPSFYYKETQITVTLQSHDPDYDPSALSIIAASAALNVSDIAFDTTIGAVSVGWVDGQPQLLSSASQAEASDLSLLYAGTEDKTYMIEAAANQLPEHKFIQAMEFAHSQLDPVLALQHKLVEVAGKSKRQDVVKPPPQEYLDAAYTYLRDKAIVAFSQLAAAKSERALVQDALQDDLRDFLTATYPDAEDDHIRVVIEKTVRNLRREALLLSAEPRELHARVGSDTSTSSSSATSFSLHGCPVGTRADGRGSDQVRPVVVDTDVLPRAHGSSVFSRGDTQSLATVTLGPQQRQPLGYGRERKSDFFLHYDFPPYCINDTGRVGGINRRMVGHGALAEKAVAPVVPSTTDFPYTIRVTSEVSGSDGSSSMASVCSAALALCDAAVPISSLVAGISVGLVTPDKFSAGDKYLLLLDILGLEDYAGDMDFKVAGSKDGITAIQLDTKLAGIPSEVLQEAIWKAREGRCHIIDEMAAQMPPPRTTFKDSAPRFGTVDVPATLRGKLIGTGGSNLKRIISETGATIDIVDGTEKVQVYAPTEAAMARTVEMIEEVIAPPEDMFTMGADGVAVSKYSVGDEVEGKVVEVLGFGAVLQLPEDGLTGFIHISELAHERTSKVEDEVQLGESVKAKVVDIDVSGRMKLSIKALKPAPAAKRHPRRQGPGGDRDRSPRGRNQHQGGPRNSQPHRRVKAPPSSERSGSDGSGGSDDVKKGTSE